MIEQWAELVRQDIEAMANYKPTRRYDLVDRMIALDASIAAALPRAEYLVMSPEAVAEHRLARGWWRKRLLRRARRVRKLRRGWA